MLRTLLTCLSLWALCAAPGAHAMASRSALIVAVSVYASSEITPLHGVQADIPLARDIATAMGIPKERVRVLSDGQATKPAVLQALQQLADETTSGGRVLVYFSGHGTRWFDPALKGCKEGLLAHDGQAITNEEIAQRTRAMSEKADKVVVLFDACHSGGVGKWQTTSRSAAARGTLTPKFFLKNGQDEQACSQPTNLKTRSLLAESSRLGALSENFVQITSARPDEVSFDEPDKGGLATQGIHGCLLGQAGSADTDGSGAVSMQEIEQCTQRFINAKLQPWPALQPHHVTVTGNRNIVPAPVSRPPAAPEAVTTAAPTTPLPAPEPALASLATLRDIAAQADPRRRLDVKLGRDTLRIGKDTLDLQLRSSHDGHVYLVLLGSDSSSFYVLFPNGLDTQNRIQAGQRLSLPRPDWRLAARGPAGTDQLLVLVTDSPRDLSTLGRPAPDAANPFTFALNTLPGRSALFDLFTGSGVAGGSESFGAKLLAIKEVP